MDAKKILKTFKTLLNEAAKMFGVPPYKVNYAQFDYVAKRKLPKSSVDIFGGFRKLKAYVAPSPDGADTESTKAMQALLKSLNGGK